MKAKPESHTQGAESTAVSRKPRDQAQTGFGYWGLPDCGVGEGRPVQGWVLRVSGLQVPLPPAVTTQTK